MDLKKKINGLIRLVSVTIFTCVILQTNAFGSNRLDSSDSETTLKNQTPSTISFNLAKAIEFIDTDVSKIDDDHCEKNDLDYIWGDYGTLLKIVITKRDVTRFSANLPALLKSCLTLKERFDEKGAALESHFKHVQDSVPYVNWGNSYTHNIIALAGNIESFVDNLTSNSFKVFSRAFPSLMPNTYWHIYEIFVNENSYYFALCSEKK